MSDAAELHLRLAEAGDEDFILGLTERFVDFELPPWRKRSECAAGIRRDLTHHLREEPPGSYLFVAEDAEGERVGLLHMQKVADVLTGRSNAHISDLAVAHGRDGQGIGRALLAYAEDWAREHACALVTLHVFPGNARGRHLYEAAGYDSDTLRLAKPVK